MVYIIYKNVNDKDNLQEMFTKINNVLYDGNEVILNKFYSRITLINYDSINNSTLINTIDNDDYINCINGNIYYNYFVNKYKKDYSLSDIINLYTHVISCDNEELLSIADTNDDNYNSCFYGPLAIVYQNKLKNNEDKIEIDDDILNLGLLAFSNRVDTFKDNDLLKGYLYDRKALRNKYESVMGEDSFSRLNYYYMSIAVTKINSNSIPKIEYLGLLNDLKKYFLINMDKKDDISLYEKNAMIINFNSLYTKLRDDYLNNKKKTI